MRYAIEEGMVIDDMDAVLEGIAKISGKPVPAAETVKKFIQREKNTKFYIDDKCACHMQPDRSTVYLWLDSGFTDLYGNPILISLLYKDGVYTGHYFGNAEVLSWSIKSHFSRNAKEINRNLGNFRNKYAQKIADREHLHIEDENDYLLEISNGDVADCVMRFLLQDMDIPVEAEPELEVLEPQPAVVETPEEAMTAEEREMTFDLMWEKIDSLQDYVNELLAEIEKFKSEDQAHIQELEAKNEEYKRAFVQMRTFLGDEKAAQVAADQSQAANGFGGHELLGNRGRILVLGSTNLDVPTMYGIAKLYGFEKKDFEFVTDYRKVVSASGRINHSDRYTAIIFGACPHKVAGLGDWSSIIEKCKCCDYMPDAYDARSHSGELKVTKESFKKTLLQVCEALRLKKVG